MLESKKNEPCRNLTSQISGDFRNVSPGQLPMFCLQLGGFLRRRAPVDASEALQALHPALQRDIDRFHGAHFRGDELKNARGTISLNSPHFGLAMFQDFKKRHVLETGRAVFTNWTCGIRLYPTSHSGWVCCPFFWLQNLVETPFILLWLFFYGTLYCSCLKL